MLFALAASLAAGLLAPLPSLAQGPVEEALGTLTGGGGSAADETPNGGDEAEGKEGKEVPRFDLEEVVEGNPLRISTWKQLVVRFTDRFLDFLPDLLYAVLILALFYGLYCLIRRLLTSLLRRTRADPALQTIGVRILRIVLLGLALVAAASQLGFQVGSLLAGIGVVGLAVGLAAQETLANLIAGLTILWDRPFRIGDNVTIAGTFGRVEEIGLRSTRIRTVDERDAVLPNKDVINEKILNHTLTPRLRLDVPFGIAYKEDTREARKVLLAAVEDHPMLLSEPDPQVVVIGLGESSVDMELRVWLRNPHRERVAACTLLELIKITLDEAGIEIPFPQRTLHLGDGELAEELRSKLSAVS